MKSSSRSLPPGWDEAPIGALVEPRVFQGPPTTPVPYIEISAIDRDRKRIVDAPPIEPAQAPTRARQWVKSGDVLVSLTRPNLNAVAMVPESLDGAVASTGFDVLRSTCEVLPEWLLYRVRSAEFVKDVCAGLQGVVYPAIRPKDVRAHRIPLPPPGEQRGIVEALDSYFSRLDDVEAGLARVERNLKRYRASVLQAAVTGRLVPTEASLARAEGRSYEPASELLQRILAERYRRWAETGKKRKYKEPLAPDGSVLAELPEGWCWASPGQVFTWSSGEFLPKKKQRGGSIPVFGGNGINGYHNEALIDRPTIVIGRVGAHCGNVHTTSGPAWITDNAIFASAGADLAFLPWWQIVMSLAKLNADSGGTGQPYVNQAHLNNAAVPLPPEAEQTRIGAELDSRLSIVGELISALSRDAARLSPTRQSILNWAFEGKLSSVPAETAGGGA